MNWLGIVVLAFILFSSINGGRRGLVKTLISMVTLVLALVLVSVLSPYIGEILETKTPIAGNITIISYILSFLIAIILIKIITGILEMIASFPVLNLLNWMGGALLGGIQGVLVIWILLLIITVLSNTEVGRQVVHLIETDSFLQVLNEHNILLQWIKGFTL